MSVEVKERNCDRWRTTMAISGPAEEVQQWLVKYEKSYPAAGYGTFWKQIGTEENGNVTFSLSRMNSCD